jgi:PAS domain-containing protein
MSTILEEIKELSTKLDKLEQEEAIKKDREVLLLLNAVTDAVIVSDEAGIIKYANPSTYRILGYFPDELLGKDIHSILQVDYLKNKVERSFQTSATNKDNCSISVYVYVGQYSECNSLSLISILRKV